MFKLLKTGLLAGIIVAVADSTSQAVDQAAIDKAIEKGVEALCRMQSNEGTWPNAEIGATALAGLTLLECGVKQDDRAIFRAADAVRRASLTLNHNYSISLAILFFDRLGDPADLPLIESLTVRLLAGQTQSGGWSYLSPPVGEAEARRLQAKLAERKELVGLRELPKPGAVKRNVKDLPRELQQQIALINRLSMMDTVTPSDNSNTQFATLALWVARRYGIPVDNALRKVETRFRTSQHEDGGWGYFDRGMMVGPMAASTASMTCAGLLGLAVADARVSEALRERKRNAKPTRDINKDPIVRKGLYALSTVIGQPQDRAGRREVGAEMIPQVGGRTYYFLWSLERVAVALDLKTIGKKDWYAWGAELLVANQQKDGTWLGTYAPCGADTCFSLLFLKRSNVVPDLTSQLTGRVQDPGERILKQKEPGRDTRILDKGIAAGIESKDAQHREDGRYPSDIVKKSDARSLVKLPSEPPALVKPDQLRPREEKSSVDKQDAKRNHPEASASANRLTSATARMAADLAKSTGSRQALLLKDMREGKGAEFTEALALAIPQLKGEMQKKAREALLERFSRMKDSTLAVYLTDEDREIRRAAALAAASKGSKSLVPDLITLLSDPHGFVAEAAHQALKELSGQDFGPQANAARAERKEAEQKWLQWWNTQKRPAAKKD
jgi:hypothetical protein